MKKLISLFPFIALAIIFRDWFTAKEVIGGDWPYFFSSFLKEFTLFPPSWALYQGNGLGGQFISYPLDSYLYFIVSIFVNTLHIPWEIVSKVFFFGLFLLLSMLSSIYMSDYTLGETKDWQKFLSAFIYTVNTYILMVVAGGQMGVALAYSLAPLVLGLFIKHIDRLFYKEQDLKSSIVAGLVLALQIMFDLRIAYITMLAVVLYIVVYLIAQRLRYKLYTILSFIFFIFVIPISIAIVLHASWILPILMSHATPLDALITSYSSSAGFKFFSFASFSQTISMLHPNWPENIFGKLYFMRPEFLITSIIVFSSLFFITKVVNKTTSLFKKIIFFVLLGLLGAFLAKGANSPFGEVNIWLFEHAPGFSLLRDPTKFYLLIALSYSVLIPFSIYSIYNWLKSKFKSQNFLPNIFPFFIICYLLFLIRPVLLSQLGGTFKEHKVPHEYIELKNFLNNQSAFFRTLWIPKQQRFAYYSNLHPSIEAMSLFSKGNKSAFVYATNSAEIIDQLKTQKVKEYIQALSIKYVIVPYDALGEIFIRDRKYDAKQYLNIIENLEKISWLKRINGFGRIAVFKIENPKDHFWIKEGKIVYKMQSFDRYSLKISIVSPTVLIFSETYNPYWVMQIDNKFIPAEKTRDGTISFKVEKTGNYNAMVYFSKRLYYLAGWAFSILVLFLLGTFLYLQKK